MADDPILEARRRWARWGGRGRRLGYGAYGLAVVLFVVGLIGTLTDGLATAIVVLLVGGSAALLPGVIIGYAVRAAERHDRELGA